MFTNTTHSYTPPLTDTKWQLRKVDNVLPFEQVVESDRIIAAIRPYILCNLYDRIRYIFIMSVGSVLGPLLSLLTAVEMVHRSVGQTDIGSVPGPSICLYVVTRVRMPNVNVGSMLTRSLVFSFYAVFERERERERCLVCGRS